MERLVINGGKPLQGKVTVSGAKNAVLKLMAASLMCKGVCTIRNVPDIKDVRTMAEVLKSLGARVSFEPGGIVRIDSTGDIQSCTPYELVREMRASVQVLGPLVARLGTATVSQPGGCAIGARPINLHLQGLRALGARIYEEHGYITVTAGRLVGTTIHLDFPSVGATENIMMAASLASGITHIVNAAREPEIQESQNFLNCMGARISGAGTDQIRIEGVESLGEADYTVIPDRIEAGTYMVAGAMTGGEVRVEGAIPEHLESVISKLTQAGIEVERHEGAVTVRGKDRPRAVCVKTLPYPGFPTDMQPQFVALLSLAEGTSLVTENVHTNRFKHVDELRRMGADIVIEGKVAVIRGVKKLTGAVVEAMDLRAGAALVIAGLAAQGETVVEGLSHIDRGYERFEQKLRALGADVERIDA